MACKLKFQPNPTFELPVSVPVAGKFESEDVVFTVKNLPVSKLREIAEGDVVYANFGCEVVTGWDIDVPFNQDNLLILFDNYPILARLLYEAYGKEVYKAAEKN